MRPRRKVTVTMITASIAVAAFAVAAGGVEADGPAASPDGSSATSEPTTQPTPTTPTTTTDDSEPTTTEPPAPDVTTGDTTVIDTTTPVVSQSAPVPSVVPLDSGSSDAAAADVATECSLLSATVDRGTANFVVGPTGCEGEVGPISFSAFFLPGGMREPYEDQVLIAHHESNGTSYGAGSYELTIDIGTPCNWQTDLYFGVDLMPKFRGLIAYDFDEREVCSSPETTTTTTLPPTTSTTVSINPTGVGSDGGEASTTTTTTTTTTTMATTTTTSMLGGSGGAGTTSTVVASAGPLPTQASVGGTLPATGSSNVPVLVLLGGLLVGAGVLSIRLTRQH